MFPSYYYGHKLRLAIAWYLLLITRKFYFWHFGFLITHLGAERIPTFVGNTRQESADYLISLWCI